MSEIIKRLQNGEILLSDGAMGTELQKHGLPSGHCPEEYNFSHPQIIRSIYSDYYEAGSQIVETNSFGGNRIRLAAYNMQERTTEFCRRSAELAKEVCPPGCFVAGSIGPSGEMLKPLGNLTPEQAYDIFAEQAEALAEGGADILFVETMMAVEEAESALRAVKEASGLPVAATMTFDKTEAGIRSSWGVDAATAVERLSAAGADLLGANCGNGVEIVVEVISQMRSLTSLPLLAQPNAGLPEIIENRIVYKETPQSMAKKMREILDVGANIIGGCCGTTPDHIRAFKKLLNKK